MIEIEKKKTSFMVENLKAGKTLHKILFSYVK